MVPTTLTSPGCGSLIVLRMAFFSLLLSGIAAAYLLSRHHGLLVDMQLMRLYYSMDVESHSNGAPNVPQPQPQQAVSLAPVTAEPMPSRQQMVDFYVAQMRYQLKRTAACGRHAAVLCLTICALWLSGWVAMAVFVRDDNFIDPQAKPGAWYWLAWATGWSLLGCGVLLWDRVGLRCLAKHVDSLHECQESRPSWQHHVYVQLNWPQASETLLPAGSEQLPV